MALLQRSWQIVERRPLARLWAQHFSTGTAKADSFAVTGTATSQHLTDPPPDRLENIRAAKPFSHFLTDTHNRQHNYLRISITEKCNLRCLYCMPEEGVPLSPKSTLLTPFEIAYLSRLFVSEGVDKIRLTGGEPTVHPQFLQIVREIGALRSHGLRQLAITTNGITLARKLDEMVESGVTAINLSLDTLDPFQFEIMTRRKGFERVMQSIDKILALNQHGAGLKLKVNVVVIRGLNDAQIMPFVDMTRDKDLEIRFIEYMPFSGNRWSSQKMLGYREMLSTIRQTYPGLQKIHDDMNETSKTYQIPGFVGRVGFITSMTDHFCGTCNRLRITSDGNLKVCLFGDAEVSLRDMLRSGFNNGDPIDSAAWDAMRHLESDNFGNEMSRHSELQERLLGTIGAAVQRKKARHAGIGVLEHMKNRPMILIDSGIGRSQWPRESALTHSISARPTISVGLLAAGKLSTTHGQRPHHFSTLPNLRAEKSNQELTHLTESGAARMVHIPPPTPVMAQTATSSTTHKPATSRGATAEVTVNFSTPLPYKILAGIDQSASDASFDAAIAKTKGKGDVFAVARIAGIQAAKQTSSLIPLCHNIFLSGASVDLQLLEPKTGEHTKTTDHGAIIIKATVHTFGQTGVEMEALVAASTSALCVYDMCKAVDRGMRIDGLRVIEKRGGQSGDFSQAS